MSTDTARNTGSLNKSRLPTSAEGIGAVAVEGKAAGRTYVPDTSSM